VILAGGAGTRLHSATTDERGVAVPKQFANLVGERTMLRWALDRAERFVRASRTLVVVSAEHRGFWERELSHLPPENVIVQPERRGTAAGVLLPVMTILHRDPEATIVLMPSDHFVEAEDALEHALVAAVKRAEREPDRIVLLGVTPDGPGTDYGWIVPGASDGEVAGFVEKPGPALAEALALRGGLWNTFVLAARVKTLGRAFARALPDLVVAFAEGAQHGGLPSDFANLPLHDFSRDVLEHVVESLRYEPVEPCGWIDVGTPERLKLCRERHTPVAT
jgi:mannose-1-phosphate guanylyltransferase